MDFVSVETGYMVLATLVFLESVGVPVPGATALTAAGLAAVGGHLNVTVVCLLCVVASIAGGLLGFQLGRQYGVKLFTAPGWLGRHRMRAYRVSRPIMERYGSPAVLFSRGLSGLRECAPVMSGALGMPLRRYLGWNSAGAVLWVLTYVLVGYLVGSAAGITRAIQILVVVKVVAFAVVTGVAYIRRRTRQRRVQGQ